MAGGQKRAENSNFKNIYYKDQFVAFRILRRRLRIKLSNPSSLHGRRDNRPNQRTERGTKRTKSAGRKKKKQGRRRKTKSLERRNPKMRKKAESFPSFLQRRAGGTETKTGQRPPPDGTKQRRRRKGRRRIQTQALFQSFHH